MLVLEPCSRFPAKTLFRAYPALATIWAPELASKAEHHTQLWEATPEIGDVFLIRYHGEVIGVTGWYDMSEFAAGLRWHGIIPAYRRQGLSREALTQLIARIPRRYHTLCELTRNKEYMAGGCSNEG